ncbi:hypothetical protein DFH09DRAFT_1302560 [Mycena vulgaris]|nr:hypothetical protein DFH09DRAFT_1302560 [Mycena vulgaris]
MSQHVGDGHGAIEPSQLSEWGAGASGRSCDRDFLETGAQCILFLMVLVAPFIWSYL